MKNNILFLLFNMSQMFCHVSDKHFLNVKVNQLQQQS